MDNLNCSIGLYGSNEQSFSKEILKNEILPLEIFKKILSFLDDADMEQAALVNHFWMECVVSVAKSEEFSKISQLAEFIGKPLEKKAMEEAVNLLQVKSSILNYKEDILMALKNLDEYDLKKTGKIFRDRIKFFENIFSLASLYKKLDDTSQVPDVCVREYVFVNISERLVEEGCIDKAIAVIEQITDRLTRKSAFRNIFKKLIQSDNIAKAISAVNRMPNGIKKNFIYRYIIDLLIERGNMQRVIEVANMIADTEARAELLQLARLEGI